MVIRHLAVASAAAIGIGSAASAAIVSVNSTYVNNTLFAQTFDFTQNIYLDATISNAVMGGAVSATITDLNGDGAWLSTVGPNSMYSAIVDEESVRTLFDGAFSFSVGAYQSGSLTPASFGNPIPSEVVPKGFASSSLGIRLHFTLSAGDAVTFSSVFVVQSNPVPAPGAAALLALSGTVAFGRRRRA